MFEISVFSHFSAAHQLRHLRGRCEELHGHNWKIEATVKARRIGKEGVTIDFGILKQKLGEVLASLDHTHLNDHPYFRRREPSSENIARFVFDRLRASLERYPVTLERVTAWESETACATFVRARR